MIDYQEVREGLKSVLEVREITRRFGGLVVVNKVTLSVQ